MRLQFPRFRMCAFRKRRFVCAPSENGVSFVRLFFRFVCAPVISILVHYNSFVCAPLNYFYAYVRLKVQFMQMCAIKFEWFLCAPFVSGVRLCSSHGFRCAPNRTSAQRGTEGAQTNCLHKLCRTGDPNYAYVRFRCHLRWHLRCNLRCHLRCTLDVP